ncbi:hypothetical protein [Sphingobium aquiterrae]|uniref:hypothetical protein n=1 Tax=Sphingobium aquiterrae TaxID=2038656 RepID=UPI00301985BE
MKLLILVVVYGRPWRDSETLASLLKAGDLAGHKVTIWDNSPTIHQDDSLLAEFRERGADINFVLAPDNRSLSEIYNLISEEAAHFDGLMLLDQDTALPSSFIRSLSTDMRNNADVNLFLPIVRCGSRIVSPGSLILFKGKHWKEERRGRITSKNLACITSGMTIRSAYFAQKSLPFDQRLNFYGIDTKFMLDYAKVDSFAYITDATLVHDSALWSPISKDEFLKRFRLLRKSSLIVFGGSPIRYFLALLYQTYCSIKYAIIYKDIRFIAT